MGDGQSGNHGVYIEFKRAGLELDMWVGMGEKPGQQTSEQNAGTKTIGGLAYKLSATTLRACFSPS